MQWSWDVTVEGSVDVSDAMKDDDHHTDLPYKIWYYRAAHFYAYVGYNFTGMTQSQIISLVCNVCEWSFGGDVVSKVKQLYSGDENKAFLCNHGLHTDKDGMQHMMGFSLPQLLALLVYASLSHKNLWTTLYTSLF